MSTSAFPPLTFGICSWSWGTFSVTTFLLDFEVYPCFVCLIHCIGDRYSSMWNTTTSINLITSISMCCVYCVRIASTMGWRPLFLKWILDNWCTRATVQISISYYLKSLLIVAILRGINTKQYYFLVQENVPLQVHIVS